MCIEKETLEWLDMFDVILRNVPEEDAEGIHKSMIIGLVGILGHRTTNSWRKRVSKRMTYKELSDIVRLCSPNKTNTLSEQCRKAIRDNTGPLDKPLRKPISYH